MARLLIAFGLVAALLTTAAQAYQAATVYRWVDAQGHVHYSQTPPSGTHAKAKAVDIAPPPPDPTTVARMQDMQQSVHDRKEAHQALAEKAQQEADKKAKQEKACATARQRAQHYADVRRVIKKNQNGKTDYYSGEDLVKLRQQAQAEADKLCSS